MSLIRQQVTMLRDCAVAYKSTGLGKILEQAADTIEELSAKLHSANMERGYRKESIYIRCLDIDSMYGCYGVNVCYLTRIGDFERIRKLAAANNITLIQLSETEFNYYRR